MMQHNLRNIWWPHKMIQLARLITSLQNCLHRSPRWQIASCLQKEFYIFFSVPGETLILFFSGCLFRFVFRLYSTKHRQFTRWSPNFNSVWMRSECHVLQRCHRHLLCPQTGQEAQHRSVKAIFLNNIYLIISLKILLNSIKTDLNFVL